MGLKVFSNLPPYIKDVSNNVRIFNFVYDSYIYTLFTP
jgi:hypothetical protein